MQLAKSERERDSGQGVRAGQRDRPIDGTRLTETETDRQLLGRDTERKREVAKPVRIEQL